MNLMKNWNKLKFQFLQIIHIPFDSPSHKESNDTNLVNVASNLTMKRAFDQPSPLYHEHFAVMLASWPNDKLHGQC